MANEPSPEVQKKLDEAMREHQEKLSEIFGHEVEMATVALITYEGNSGLLIGTTISQMEGTFELLSAGTARVELMLARMILEGATSTNH